MQGKSRWIGFLIIMFMAAGADRTFAAPEEEVSSGRELQTVEKQALTDVVFQRSASDIIKFFPLPEGTKHFRYVVGQEGGAVAGAVAEKLIYQSKLGAVAAQVPPNQLIADDINFTALPGCKLRRYNFNVIGKANPSGPGGDYTVSYSLYDNCPGAGGVALPGTSGQITIPAAQVDVVITVTVSIPTDVDIPLPASPWMGLSTSRNNVGIIMGAPATVGFSQDIVDFPGFACNANLGGFPNFEHATFTAELYGDLSCVTTNLGYHNVHDARGNFNPAGADNWMADDITLGVDGCNMVAYEVGVRDVGFYTFEILRDSGGFPSSTAVSGTRKFMINNNPGMFKSQSFKFTTPIPLDSSVFFAVRVGNDIGGAVLTGRDASWGRTGPNIFVLLNEQWSSTAPPIGNHGGLYFSIQCAGEAPVGACCDMFLPDELGDVSCFDVPEINCSFPLRGSSLRPRWNEGVPCRVCSHGTNDGLACRGIEDCLGDFCIGGLNDGRPCTTNDDCTSGVCTIATCEDNDDAFLVRCGVAACCKPAGANGAFCENLTRNECDAIEPVENPRQWERGRFCNSQGQRCPNPNCLDRRGECTADLPKRCVGGVLDGDICDLDRDCQGYCDLNNQTCDGGDRDGLICENALNCPPDGVCRGFCLGGDPHLQGDRCINNAPCRVGQDNGTCLFSGGDDTGVCQGGAREGSLCFSDRNCKETTCECIPGCSQPLCCTDVCESLDPFCCEECWDEICSLQAASICLPNSPSNDECAPTGQLVGAKLIKINDRVDINVGNATDSPFDPGFCCNTGRRSRCVGGGLQNNTFCDSSSDCTCDIGVDPLCEGNGFCPPRSPEPGAQALKTTWYRFDIPQKRSETDPDFVSIQISTCLSNLPADDSLLQVFSIPTSDLGVCVDLGRCEDRFACNVAANDCQDGSSCIATSEDCSVSTQDCPLGLECVLNLDIACDNLSPIGCNDDAGDICSFDKRRNSFLCLPNLVRGQSYLIMMGVKEEESSGTYRLDITATSSCPGSGFAANDECVNSMEIAEGQTPFDLGEASFSCPAEGCLLNMQNDLWYNFTPDRKGTAFIETCGPDAASTPDTEMVIYEGCGHELPFNPFRGCPPPAPISCSGICEGKCLLGSCSTVPMEANTCYMIRVADHSGGGGAGNLTLKYLPENCDISDCKSNPACVDCNKNGIQDECDIASGTSDDCNHNDIPDECEPDCNANGIADDCDISACISNPACADCNGNGIPDECDLADGSLDCNTNDIPDECEQDCNNNGQPDLCDFSDGISLDCNSNNIPDECDIADGISLDCNDNTIPDDCEECCVDSDCVDDGDQCTAEVCNNGVCTHPDNNLCGACCDRFDGSCKNDIFQGNCTGRQPNWSVGESCQSIICDPATGACCNTRLGPCTNNLILAECQGEHLSWTKGEDCSTQNCPDPLIPTVSQWGLAVLTLLLLIGAKIYFGFPVGRSFRIDSLIR